MVNKNLNVVEDIVNSEQHVFKIEKYCGYNTIKAKNNKFLLVIVKVSIWIVVYMHKVDFWYLHTEFANKERLFLNLHNLLTIEILSLLLL